MAKLPLAPAVVAVLLSAGCAVQAGPSGPPDDRQLWGRTFSSVAGPEGSTTIRFVPGTHVTLTFGQGRLQAGAGCNQISGSVTLDKGRVTLRDAQQTLMGCSSELQAQDAWLTRFLNNRPRWRMESGNLVLSDGGTELTLTDHSTADPDRPLQGTRWVVEGIVDGSSEFSVPKEPVAYLQIADGGRVEGSTGCRGLQGNARLHAGRGTVTFSVAVDSRPCRRELRRLDAAVTSVLRGQVDYRIEADRLLLSGSGSKSLRLRAQQ